MNHSWVFLTRRAKSPSLLLILFNFSVQIFDFMLQEFDLFDVARREQGSLSLVQLLFYESCVVDLLSHVFAVHTSLYGSNQYISFTILQWRISERFK